MNIAVLGGGSFGTALAHVVAMAGHNVTMLIRNEDLANDINQKHENTKYLSGLKICDKVKATINPEILADCEVWIIALPCQQQENILSNYKTYFSDQTILINVAKGIVLNKKVPLSMVIPGIFDLPNDTSRYAVLSGPSFAKEVLEEQPVACVLACEDILMAKRLQEIFNTSFFRCYSSTDVIGLELGGAVKNIIAIAAGMSDGLNFGHNARAALVTRGLAEISRFGAAMGAHYKTFMGLSGLGDLMLTCTGDLSRNRRVGLGLGRGEKLADIIKNMNGVAEGIPTTNAVYEIAQNFQVEMPIVNIVYAILNDIITPREGLQILMERALKSEVDVN